MRINTMTKERKTSILALIIICIACLLAAGCATKKKAMTETATEQKTTKVEQVKDTAITETHDTTRITQKLIPVEIAVPEAMLERTTKDTTSVLETDLYKSTSTWANGVLTHTLERYKARSEAEGTGYRHGHHQNLQKELVHEKHEELLVGFKEQPKDTQQTTKTTQASWDIWLGSWYNNRYRSNHRHHLDLEQAKEAEKLERDLFTDKVEGSFFLITFFS